MPSCFKSTSSKSIKKKSKNRENSSELAQLIREQSIYSENEINFKSDIKYLIKDIEDESIKDSEIISKIDGLLEHHGSQFRRNLFESQTGYDNFSLLHYSCKTCRFHLSQYFIDELKIDPDVNSKSKMTPLHLLIKSNIFTKQQIDNNQLLSCTGLTNEKINKFVKTFELLIERKCNCNLQDDSNFTALHHAVNKNNYQAVLLLLNLENIELDVLDERSMTPLHIACKYGYIEIADLLVEKTNSKKLFSPSVDTLPIHLACKTKQDNSALIKKMLDKIKLESKEELSNTLQKLDSNKNTVLQLAIENNHLNTTDCLLKDYYKDLNLKLEDRNGNLPIHFAAKSCGAEMLKVLIKNNCFTTKPNGNMDNPLHIAAANNKFKFIKEFLSHEKMLIEKLNLKDYISTVKGLNRNGHTPLFVALINGYVKCADALLTTDIDLDTKDLKGNSIYHICAEFNNCETMRVLLSKKDQRFIEPLHIRNEDENHAIHVACIFGHVEVIKLAINKLNEGFASLENYLLSKNKDGKNCFHIACMKGYFNIIEYFLKDLNINYFIDQVDYDLNTPLHLASSHGHLSIVFILLDHGADLNVKNKDGLTALELSCRLGFFEIGKLLISRYSILQSNQNKKSSDYPLHIACYEGAYELVELLLAKGAVIDILTEDNKNCLDIAISRGHREVVKVLLQDKNWDKLINTTSVDRHEHKINLVNIAFKRQIQRFTSTSKKENPQLVAMFENKMWESLKLVLDNCKKGNEYNFKILDPPCKTTFKHPLMLMARSGQETLLKHETTEQLLKLKWRFIPRFAFYSNIFLYLTYLILFAFYSTELSNFIADKPNFKKIDEFEFESGLSNYLIVIIIINLIKKFLQIVLVDRLAFFVSFTNWFEVITFILALAAIITKDLSDKLNLCSFSILSSFIVFSFLIQKLKVFGLYVLAFRRTIQNSARFFPIFFLIYIGFNLSYRVRTNFGVSNFNTTTGLTLVKTLSMALGELDDDAMGLDIENMETTLFLNYLIYFLFIGLMCIITFNLFVGIAVGEIKTVLDEADIQQISMRIIFVLKVQETLNRFNKKFCLKWLNIRYEEYNYQNEFKFIKTKDKIVEFLDKRFTPIEPEIKLVDPSKRLEDNINELSRTTNADLKSIRELLTNQISDVETKLTNSQQRLEDCLVEMSRKTTNNFETTQEDSLAQLDIVHKKVIDSEKLLNTNINDFNKKTQEKMDHLESSYNTQLKNTKQELITAHNKLENNLSDLASLTNNINILANNQFREINKTFIDLFERMNILKEDISIIADSLNQMNHGQSSLITMNKNFGSRLDNFIIENDVKQVLDNLVDHLIHDSKKEENENKEN